MQRSGLWCACAHSDAAHTLHARSWAREALDGVNAHTRRHTLKQNTPTNTRSCSLCRAKVPAAPWLDTLRSSGVDISVCGLHTNPTPPRLARAHRRRHNDRVTLHVRARADYDALLGDVRAWLAEHTGAVLVPADASFAIHSQASAGSAPEPLPAARVHAHTHSSKHGSALGRRRRPTPRR